MKKEHRVVAFCGICCDDCFGRKGKIADLARELRKELRAAHFEFFAAAMAAVPQFEPLAHYPQCYEALGSIDKLRCKKLCRDGGCTPLCAIRTCARAKKLDGCWQCGEFEACEKLTPLAVTHGDAIVRNLRRIKRNGLDAFLTGKREWMHIAPKKKSETK
ncbi:MAG TPA: DUF3795 domain-containing protein [bacterium]|nr:DUF3795 domain-containing protein [bacterium]